MEDLRARVEVCGPIQLVSEANVRTHWRVRAARAKAQRGSVKVLLGSKLPAGRFWLPARVVITRLGTRLLDSDNLAGSAKAVRDEIAAWLGCGDSPQDPVTWEYQQLTIKEAKVLYPEVAKWKYGLRVEVVHVG